jgi:hypothetical protein
MIQIMNLKHNPNPGKIIDFFIDRRSPVGNPFAMKTESERNFVCDQYQTWFDLIMDGLGEPPLNFKEYINTMRDTHKRFGNINLWCWCAPKRCHGNTIKQWLEDTAL